MERREEGEQFIWELGIHLEGPIGPGWAVGMLRQAAEAYCRRSTNGRIEGAGQGGRWRMVEGGDGW